MTVKSPKKLIEVALPLDAINAAAMVENSKRYGKLSSLHLWWSPKVLSAARAVIFAQLVNDPGYERHLQRGVNNKEAAKERERLFEIIKKLVLWENTNNEAVLEEARAEIWKSWQETCSLNKNHPQAAELFNPDKLPAFHDPFAGGGTIPLEAQRLGLKSYASDLNPVAVLINKAMIEIPPKFAGRKPIGPVPKGDKQGTLHEDWSGAKGMAEDVRRYGHWIREEAKKRIGDLYPPVEITAEMAQERPDLKPLAGKKLTVIAWLWARTVRSPNPAYSHVEVPLASTFMLSTKAGKEAYVEPVVAGDRYHFKVKVGEPTNVRQVRKGTKLARGSFGCLLSNTPIRYSYIDDEANAGRMKTKLLAVVAEGHRGRIYLSPTKEMEEIARKALPTWKPDTPSRGTWASNAQGRRYGFRTFGDYFTPRQLVMLSTLSDLVQEARKRVKQDALDAGMIDDGQGLDAGGNGATAYADSVAINLAVTLDKFVDLNNGLADWEPEAQCPRHLFSRQAIPMMWEFAEACPFSSSSGSWEVTLKGTTSAIESLFQNSGNFLPGIASQEDAASISTGAPRIVSTDPPYYDNVSYADLSDFFYVWLRRTLKPVFPSLFATLAVPKTEELVAVPYRHGSKENAEAFFLDGMTRAMNRLTTHTHLAFPTTIYYAFKASESSDQGTTSTGWETFLEAVLRAGFAITGTWPLRTEKANRQNARKSNVLASSILLVCRQRDPEADTISRRTFLRELNTVLPEALDDMTRGGVNSPVDPVDLSQAIIGPGMAIFSKYTAVLEADGTPMPVRTALQLINRFLAEEDFDHDTQFCLHWFETYGWSEGKFGEADVLARAKGTSVGGVADAGVLESGKSIVRLLRYAEYPTDWSPDNDKRIPVWEALHHLLHALQRGGETVSGELLAKMPTRIEAIRQLAYRLYTLCERKGWADDARAYNELITSWQAIEAASHEIGHVGKQIEMDL